MNTTDTQFDRLAAVTQEAVDMLKAAIERAEAAEAKCAQLRKQRDLFWSQRDALQCQLDDLSDNRNPRRNEKVRNQRRELDALGNAYRIVCAERDALQARIDAGVRVTSRYIAMTGRQWVECELEGATGTALLIDRQPAVKDDRFFVERKPADHIADAGKMVDDDREGEADSKQPDRRKGERRKFAAPYIASSYYSMSEDDVWRKDRRTPGTVADRRHWTRADGSVTPERQGERRKGLEERCTDACRRAQCRESVGPCYTQSDADDYHDNRRDPSGANDRRKGKA